MFLWAKKHYILRAWNYFLSSKIVLYFSALEVHYKVTLLIVIVSPESRSSWLIETVFLRKRSLDNSTLHLPIFLAIDMLQLPCDSRSPLSKGNFLRLPPKSSLDFFLKHTKKSSPSPGVHGSISSKRYLLRSQKSGEKEGLVEARAATVPDCSPWPMHRDVHRVLLTFLQIASLREPVSNLRLILCVAPINILDCVNRHMWNPQNRLEVSSM
jgi:hypothetical protein